MPAPGPDPDPTVGGAPAEPAARGRVAPRQPQSSATASSVALAGAIVTTAANFGIAIVVGRAGAAFAGVFFAATAVVTILGSSAGLGTMTGQVYFMPLALAGPEPNPRALLTVALRPVAVASLAAGAAIVAGAGPAAGVIAPQQSSELAGMLRALAVTVPALAVTMTLLGATRGLGSMTPTVAVNQLLRPLGQLVSIGALLAIEPDPSELAVAAAWGWPVVAAAAAALAAVWRLGGLAGGPGPGAVPSSEFWRFCRPRSVATAFQIALERVDVVLVSALAGEAAAGVYGAVSRFATAGNFLIFSIGQATSPELRRALVAGQLEAAGRLLRRVTGWMVLLVWPYALLVAVKAEPLAALLSPDFAPGAGALTILAGVMMASALAGPIDLTLLMLGRSRASLAGVVAALAADLGLAWLLLPRVGIAGAAVAWGAAVWLQNGIATVLVHRAAGLRAPGRAAVVAGIGAVTAVVPIGVVTPDDLLGLMTTAVVATGAYLTWLLRFGPVLGLPHRPAGHLARR